MSSSCAGSLDGSRFDARELNATYRPLPLRTGVCELSLPIVPAPVARLASTVVPAAWSRTKTSLSPLVSALAVSPVSWVSNAIRLPSSLSDGSRARTVSPPSASSWRLTTTI